MKQRIDQIITENILRLYKTKGFKSENELAKKSGVSQKTVNFLLDESTVSNPTATVLERLSACLGCESWMLHIPDFPFDKLKHPHLKTLSGPTYIVASVMEQEPLPVQLLMMESASHVLMSIDKKQSTVIKDAQAVYLK